MTTGAPKRAFRRPRRRRGRRRTPAAGRPAKSRIALTHSSSRDHRGPRRQAHGTGGCLRPGSAPSARQHTAVFPMAPSATSLRPASVRTPAPHQPFHAQPASRLSGVEVGRHLGGVHGKRLFTQRVLARLQRPRWSIPSVARPEARCRRRSTSGSSSSAARPAAPIRTAGERPRDPRPGRQWPRSDRFGPPPPSPPRFRPLQSAPNEHRWPPSLLHAEIPTPAMISRAWPRRRRAGRRCRPRVS